MRTPPPPPRRPRRPATTIAALLVLLAAYLTVPVRPAAAAGPLLSQGRPTTASSVKQGGTPAAAATDGDPGTRWSSAFTDPQWLQVDLGATATVDQIELVWEAAYARAFQIQVAGDPAGPWQTIHSTTTGAGGTQTLAVSGTGRYVRLYGTARATGYGYSLWEFKVYGTTGPGQPPTGRPISEFKKVAASSWEGGNAPAAALDGRTATRWSSQFSDPQWLSVDFGGVATISRVVLNWEAAYATGYRLETSADGNTWTTIYSTSTGRGGVEQLAVTGSGRYLRLHGTARATGYGYSLWEFQAYGTVDEAASTAPMLSGPTRPPGTLNQFALTAPADGAMVTTTRRPVLGWAAVAGATRYQVWINISRTDYDFTAPGNLLDLYTKVAEPTGTSWTPTWDLPDRWT
ncbi:discoidin domain-containing protein [Micromonospora sp. I033]